LKTDNPPGGEETQNFSSQALNKCSANEEKESEGQLPVLDENHPEKIADSESERGPAAGEHAEKRRGRE